VTGAPETVADEYGRPRDPREAFPGEFTAKVRVPRMRRRARRQGQATPAGTAHTEVAGTRPGRQYERCRPENNSTDLVMAIPRL
jgi:hypothetical protein